MTQLKTLVSGTVEKLEAALKAQPANPKSTPEQYYEDLTAYRGRIRADLATNNLDDVHDADGNALYRLQFRAQLFPGAQKDKWGIVRIRAAAPLLDEGEVREIYNTWIAHATFRLNRPRRSVASGSTPRFEADVLYERLGNATSLYDIVTLSGEHSEVRLAVMPGHGRELERLLDADKNDCAEELVWMWQALETKSEVARLDALTLAAAGSSQLASQPCLSLTDRQILRQTSLEEKEKESDPDARRPSPAPERPRNQCGYALKDPHYDHAPQPLCRMVDEARRVLRLVPSVEAAVIGLSERGAFESDPTLKEQLEVFDQAARAAHGLLSGIVAANLLEHDEDSDDGEASQDDDEKTRASPKSEAPVVCEATRREQGTCELVRDDWVPGRIIYREVQRRIPGHVCRLLLGDDHPKEDACGLREQRGSSDPTRAKADGNSFAYRALPVERAQRVSTAASAADSVQLALALSGGYPAAGVAGDLGLAQARSATGKADAMERAPLVVGFADGTSANETAVEGFSEEAHFGWVFGPYVGLDPPKKRLVLRHTVKNHQVMADVSVPAWWPRMTLVAETAWIQNWWDAEDYLKSSNDGVFSLLRKAPERVANKIPVRLPRSRAALDSLSDALKRMIFRQHLRQARIDEIQPNWTSACDGLTTFLVSGVDLWRSPEAYLRGRRHSDIQMLPDMSGLAVTFDLSGLPPRRTGSEALTVVTQTGKDSYPVTVDASCRRAPVEGSVIAAEPVGRSVVKGRPLVLRVDPQTLPRGYAEIKIGIRRPGHPPTIDWATADAALVPGDSTLTATLPDTAYANLAAKGEVVEVSIIFRHVAGGVLDVRVLEQTLVAYNDAEKARFEVSGPRLATLPGEAQVMLPHLHHAAYPWLGSPRQRANEWKVSSTLDDGTQVEVPVLRETAIPGRARAYAVRLGAPIGLSAEQAKNFRSKERTLTFAFKDQPALVPVAGSVKLAPLP